MGVEQMEDTPVYQSKDILRKARLASSVIYWSLNAVFILGLAFMVHPDGYSKARQYRDTHVVVSLGTSITIRDLAKNMTSHDFENIKCLAVNSYFEARGEGSEGMERVDDVVLNRSSNTSRYPDGVCQVVYETKLSVDGSPKLNSCQFSWYCDGQRHEIKDRLAYQEAYEIAYNKYLYRPVGLMSDKTEGALHYHADYVSPHWTWQRLGSFGHHIFYR